MTRNCFKQKEMNHVRTQLTYTQVRVDVTDDLNILAMQRESVTKKKSQSYGHWTVFMDTVLQVVVMF